MQGLVFGTQHKALKEVTTVSKSCVICNQICSRSHFLFVSMDNHESRQIAEHAACGDENHMICGLGSGIRKDTVLNAGT